MIKFYVFFNFLWLLIFSPALAQEWEVVGKFGYTRTVYVAPEGIKDKHFIAQLLHSTIAKEGRANPIQVRLFDDKRYTPRGFPMTNRQMLHWKARYNFNPFTKLERFVWISVSDPKSSPPELKEITANIRPGYAE